jgi:nitroimidazol reductase NimA-like FMN-containing flavoprotein (pyridoxamine 5'-phosphate oxidase superfamily)
MTMDRNGLEILGEQECRRLLATGVLGRIGITSGALPVILPINYRVDGDRILFRTSPGTKLDAATHNAVVAFEVDQVDPVYHSGWSVLVTGIAADVSESAADEVTTTPRWAAGPDGRLVAITIDQISGRRLSSGGGLNAAWGLHDLT